AKTLLGFKFSLALGFFVLTVAIFLSLAASFSRFAFGLLNAFFARGALGFFFGDAPFFDVAHFGVGESAGARRALILGEGAQDDAGIVARGRRRRRGAGCRCRGRRLGGGLGYHRFR